MNGRSDSASDIDGARQVISCSYRRAIASTVTIISATRPATPSCGQIWRFGSLTTSKHDIRQEYRSQIASTKRAQGLSGPWPDSGIRHSGDLPWKCARSWFTQVG
jgi:hypothetical protein